MIKSLGVIFDSSYNPFILTPILWFIDVYDMPRFWFTDEKKQVEFIKTIPQTTFEI